MRRGIVVIVIVAISLAGTPAAATGLGLLLHPALLQFQAACSAYYSAPSEQRRQLQLKRASAALRRLHHETHLTDEKIIARLEKYKRTRPESVAVLILALYTHQWRELSALQRAVVTPDALQWAQQIVSRSSR
jgi:hypothetical protein